MASREVREVKSTGAAILAVVMIPTIAALNYVSGVIVTLLQLPIWGDTWATMLGTLISGFAVGATGGFLYNIIMALTLWGLPQWVWGVCNILVAFFTAVGIKMGWADLKKPLKLIPMVFIWGFIYPFFCTLVSIGVFGGGPIGWKPLLAAVYTLTLSGTGNFFLANYTQNVVAEILDKNISYVIALLVAAAIPESYKFRLGGW